MTEQALFVLAALSGAERHGYAIAQDAEQLSDGRVRLAAGTLYGVLTRLVGQGLIEETREEQVDGRRRRYYALTVSGAQALVDETARLRSTVEALGARLRPGLA